MSRYHKLEQVNHDDHNQSKMESPMPMYKASSRRFYLFVTAMLMLSLLMNALQYAQGAGVKELYPSEGRYAKTEQLDVVWKRFFWHTEFSPANHTASDHLWEQILPSHGFVAIDRREAEKSGWPESMYLPSDDTKGVYLLEAYHQLHCLKIIRQTFWEAVERRPYTHEPLIHVEHCFDALRQSTICDANNLPLYTFGDKTAGDGQMHRCQNWEQLRDYATANSACYRDSAHDILLGEHFGYCDDGDDGILA